MLQFMELQRVGHDLATEQQQKLTLELLLDRKSVPICYLANSQEMEKTWT